MGSRNVKRFNPAHFTKKMLGDPGVESVGGKGFGTLNESETRFRDDKVKKTAFTADRAVALDRFYLSRCFNLEPHPAAMASASVFDQVTFA
jgi:hypothetical protein